MPVPSVTWGRKTKSITLLEAITFGIVLKYSFQPGGAVWLGSRKPVKE